MTNRFKQERSFEDRKKLVKTVKESYPDCVPVIIQNRNDKTCMKFLPKFYVPWSTLVLTCRQKISDLNSYQNISLLVEYNNKFSSPSLSDTVGNVYEGNHDEDGFLYVYYCVENVFGFL